VIGTGLPVQPVSCGVPYLMIPLATRGAVDSASFDPAAFESFWNEADTGELAVFLFSTEPGADNATAYSRMFAPNIGIPEDPATGSASGPLGCYLVRHKVVAAARAGSMLSLQGAKMGRPSYIHIDIGGDDKAITSVRVGGESVLAGEAILYV